MPVRKFRSVEEMSEPVWRQPGDPTLYRAMAVVWEFTRRAHPQRFSPGVRRFRSVDDMSRAQEKATVEYIAALRKQRQGQ